MAEFNAYLKFNGNGREAMSFYKDCFGGELDIMTVNDSPVKDQINTGSVGSFSMEKVNNNPDENLSYF